MAVKFLKPCQQGSLYNEGEIAGFDAATEKRLIEQKFAEKYEAKKPAEKDEAKKPTEKDEAKKPTAAPAA